MIHVSYGTDTYGRVKVVAGTPIVTQFFMVQGLPLYPLQSFYFLGAGRMESSGIPFLAEVQTRSFRGIPLAEIDRASVVMACFRGTFGAMVLVGFLAIVPGIMYLTGERLDQFAMWATYGLLALLAMGVVGGLLTYVIPLTSRRERDIRTYCAEMLGISADPARVSPEMNQLLAQFVGQQHGQSDQPRTRLLRQLIELRANVSQTLDQASMEKETDELLKMLRQSDRTALHQ